MIDYKDIVMTGALKRLSGSKLDVYLLRLFDEERKKDRYLTKEEYYEECLSAIRKVKEQFKRKINDSLINLDNSSIVEGSSKLIGPLYYKNIIILDDFIAKKLECSNLGCNSTTKLFNIQIVKDKKIEDFETEIFDLFSRKHPKKGEPYLKDDEIRQFLGQNFYGCEASTRFKVFETELSKGQILDIFMYLIKEYSKKGERDLWSKMIIKNFTCFDNKIITDDLAFYNFKRNIKWCQNSICPEKH